MFYFQFDLQKVYLNRDRAGKISWKFWNLAAKLNRNFEPKWNCTRHVMDARLAVHKELYHGSFLGIR